MDFAVKKLGCEDEKYTKWFKWGCLALSIAIFLIPFIAGIWFILTDSGLPYNSDSFDSLMWSYATLTSHRLLSPDFCYPYLLTFGGNVVFLPFVTIFGVGITAQKASLLFYFILFSVALFGAFYVTVASLSKSFFGTGFALAVSTSGVVIREQWTHLLYYNMGIILFLLGYTSFILFIKSGKKRYAILHALFIAVCAINGFSVIVLASAPFIIVSLTELYFGFSKDLSEVFKKILIFQGAGTIAGELIRLISKRGGIDSTGYEIFSMIYTDSNEWINHIWMMIVQWYMHFGGCNTDAVMYLTKPGIFLAIALAVAAVTFIIPMIFMSKLDKLEVKHRVMTVSYWVMNAFILFGYVAGNFSTTPRRLIPCVMIASFMGVIYLFDKSGEKWTKLKVIAIIGFVCFTVMSPVKMYKDVKYMEVSNPYPVLAEFIKEHGLKFGGSDYWDANSTICYGDGAFEIAPIVFSGETAADQTPAVYRYNTFDSWCDRACSEGMEFIIVGEEKFGSLDDAYKEVLMAGGSMEKVDDLPYYVIIYDEPKKALSTWNWLPEWYNKD